MREPQDKDKETVSEKQALAGYGADSPEIEHVEMTTSTDEDANPDSKNTNGNSRLGQYNFSSASARLHLKGKAQSVLHLAAGMPESNLPGPTTNGSSLPDSFLPAPPPPVKTVGQLGAQNFVNSFKRGVKKSRRLPYTTHGGSSHRRRYPDHIGFSYHSKPPRWLIMPSHQHDHEKPEHPLQWVFDSGPSVCSSELRHSELYEIGYKWLRDAYKDAEFKHNMTSEIRMGPFAVNVADVENPLPPLPPPPHPYCTQAPSESPTKGDGEHTIGRENSPSWNRGPTIETDSSPEPEGFYTTVSNSSNTTYPDGKSLYSRYSSSSDVESQRSRVMARQFALDGAVDDGPNTQIGDDRDDHDDPDTEAQAPSTARENKPEEDQTGSTEPGQCATEPSGSPQYLPSYQTTAEPTNSSISIAAANGVIYSSNPDITGSGDTLNPVSQASDPWAPWKVLEKIRQDGSHDKIFPHLTLRRIQTWAGSYVTDDIQGPFITLPSDSTRALSRSPPREREFQR